MCVDRLNLLALSTLATLIVATSEYKPVFDVPSAPALVESSHRSQAALRREQLQGVAVRGKLMCGSEPLAGARIKLVDILKREYSRLNESTALNDCF